MEIKNSLQRQEYIARIYRVQDYIDEHLNKDLTLEELANVAGFSAYHFHRIFSTLVGESLYKYIQRTRLEKAASFLKSNFRKSITEIALELGFSNSAVFSRSFKKYYGISATMWRDSKSSIISSKNRQIESRNGKDPLMDNIYDKYCTNQNNWREFNMIIRKDVEVKTIEDMSVIYVRHVGPYAGDGALFDKLFGKLFKWAGARDLMSDEMKIFTIYHDNPSITQDDKLRISVCMTAPKDIEVDGEIGKMVVSSGKYAIGHYEVNVDQYSAAWAHICEWVIDSGYQPDDKPCFELYLNDPEQHPDKKHWVDVYMPVKPL